MNKRKIRDTARLFCSIVFSWLYIPHLIVYTLCNNRKLINSDLNRYKNKLYISLNTNWLLLIYLLHNNCWFRNIFYYRVGPIWDLVIGWWRPGDKYFVISKSTKIGEGAYFAHPFTTEINAKSIGKN